MNGKLKIVIALAIVAMCITPAMAQVPMYESKYSDVDIMSDQNPIDAVSGILKGNLLCGNNIFSKEIEIVNDIAPDKIGIISVNSDGTFEMSGLIPGNFTLTLRDGNGGQIERSHVLIVAGQTSYPETALLGHASSEYIAPTDDKTEDVCEPVNVRYDLDFDFHRGHHFDLSFDNPNDHGVQVTVTSTETYRVWHHGHFETRTDVESEYYFVRPGHSHDRLDVDMHALHIDYEVTYQTNCDITEP